MLSVCVVRIGSHQVRTYRSERHNSDQGWKVGNWDLARDLVSRIPRQQAYKKSGCYHPRREDGMMVVGSNIMQSIARRD